MVLSPDSGLAPAPLPQQKSMTLVVFSGDMDKLFAALTLASSAAAMGVSVSLFFNFWGLSALRRRSSYRGKSAIQRILTAFLPSRAGRLSMSRMNMLGAGPAFFRHVMKKKNVASVEELVQSARAVGVRFIACSMSMEVMGITPSELIDGVEFGGAAGCVLDLMKADSTLFI